MEVSAKMTFDEYWNAPQFALKRPLRNGSLKMAVGDNIYHRSPEGYWIQADSHHSHPDGTPDQSNIEVDTSSDAVLLSSNFYYFGSAAPLIPANVLADMGFNNGRNHRKFALSAATALLDEIRRHGRRNYLMADPFDFSSARSRYSAASNRIDALSV